MQDWDKIDAVDRMQKYILAHLDEEITLTALSRAAGYSLWHCSRVFKELTQKTPFAYIRAARLTKAAQELRDTGEKVIDAALASGFESHDGFTRAFARQFSITPQEYRRKKPPVSYFTCYPIRDYYLYISKRDDEKMKTGFPATVTVQAVDRPPRKLILLRSQKATDYFSYCEEKGCEWEGLLNSIPEKLDNAAILELPPNLVAAGTSACAAGVEVPADYGKNLPEGYEILDLPPCAMLYFHGMPYENEDDFCRAIDIVFEAIENYRPELYGFAFADALAPKFNFGAAAKTGAKMAVPVRRP